MRDVARPCRETLGRRQGFTLLELLVAAGLTTMVLAALWTLFSMYERLFTKADAQVQRAQLARALLQQLADDLHSAIAENASAPSAEGSSVRRFGLFGTRETLQIDVIQITPEQAARGWGLNAPEDLLTAFPEVGSQAPELHTVRYTFEPPDLLAESGGLGRWGLVRRQFDWETPLSEAELEGSEATSASGGDEFVAAMESLAGDDPLAVAAPGASVTWAPEVVGVEFRYFDGNAWSDQWNSLTRKSLPVAVEALLRVRTGDQAEPAPPAAEQSPAPAEAGEAGREVADILPAPTQPRTAPAERTYRVLVHLPSTHLAYGPKRAEAFERAVAVPLAAPMPPPTFLRPGMFESPSSHRLPLPDQWMRSGG